MTGVGKVHMWVVNAADPPGLAAFYAQLLGDVVVDSSAEWAQLATTGVAFQVDPAPKVGANRLHLDVLVVDLDAATTAVLAAGAAVRSAVKGVTSGEPWRVFVDPEGNEFCLVTA